VKAEKSGALILAIPIGLLAIAVMFDWHLFARQYST
jgi:hypothetical protein